MAYTSLPQMLVCPVIVFAFTHVVSFIRNDLSLSPNS